MSMTKCKECGKEVSSKADTCPNCGVVLKKKTGVLAYLMLGFLILVLLGLIGTVANENSSFGSKPEAGISIPSVGEQLVTYAEYQQIQDGMSYKEVIGIIGAEGEELSRNRIEGIPGVMETTITIMYQWANPSGSNMNAMFQNNKLIQKAQFGLE